MLQTKRFLPFSKTIIPNARAIGISSQTGNTEPGNKSKITAMIIPRMEINNQSSKKPIMKKNTLVRGLIYFSVNCAMETPLFLIDTIRTPKS